MQRQPLGELQGNVQEDIPPEDYRVLPIVPTRDELLATEAPFLQPNLVDNPYRDVEHYLDVQSRLLREDFVRSVRKDIQTIRAGGRADGIRRYDGVHTRESSSAQASTCEIEFDVSQFGDTNWLLSRRLIFGSMVILSADNFENMIIATVVDSERDDLLEGRLVIQVEKGHRLVNDGDSNIKYVMLESNAYFVPYQSALSSLQRKNAHSLPMAQYLIQYSTEVTPPSYLTDASQGDFSHLCGGEERQVTILDNSTWPSNEEVKLDESQYAAWKLALTKEIALIQGPPGTGKSYVGVELIRFLLANTELRCDEYSGPILVLCLTNAALDQFLEGVIEFSPKGTFRIGGQSGSKRMEPFVLKHIIKQARDEKRIPKHIHQARCQAHEKVDQVKKQIADWRHEEMDAEGRHILTGRNLSKLVKTLESRQNELEKCKMDEKLNILREATVIGVTTTGATQFRDLIDKLRPSVVIVEEAANILEAEIIAAIPTSCQHLILIGDHQQLRPRPTTHELVRYNFDISLFERLIRNRPSLSVCLTTQYRMRPEIAALVRHIYPQLIDHESVMKYESVRGVQHNMYFVDHRHEEECLDGSRSKVNLFEARYVVGLAYYLLGVGYKADQITLLTPYAAQVNAIKNVLTDWRLEDSFQDLRIISVDNYQGEENDIVILSLVRSNEFGSIGFLSDDNRVCVALSRAKKGFFVIGNFALLSKKRKSRLWAKVLGTFMTSGCVGTSLPLDCACHRLKKKRVSEGEEFKDLHGNGCNQPCGFLLSCGHQCAKKCHYDDDNHCSIQYAIDCQEIVPKQLPCGHWQEGACGEDPKTMTCLEQISVNLPNCDHKVKRQCKDRAELKLEPCGVIVMKPLVCGRHEARVACSADATKVVCTESVPYSCRRCGHTAMKLCRKRRGRACVQLVSKELTCGHSIRRVCSKMEHFDENGHRCRETCRKTLACGHPCEARCSERCRGCTKTIEVYLPCQLRLCSVKCVAGKSTVDQIWRRLLERTCNTCTLPAGGGQRWTCSPFCSLLFCLLLVGMWLVVCYILMA